jgi:prepilin-type N-terminal cleavage/methylation domain-containing protein
MNQRGVSLIELVVVIAIVAVVGALSAPPWLALAARQESWSVTRAVAGEFRVARQLAMARHARIRVVVDTDSMTVRTESAGGTSPLRMYEFSGKRLSVESMSNGNEIVFHPNGRSSTGNRIVLRDRSQNKRIISIGITGKVTVS